MPIPLIGRLNIFYNLKRKSNTDIDNFFQIVCLMEAAIQTQNDLLLRRLYEENLLII